MRPSWFIQSWFEGTNPDNMIIVGIINGATSECGQQAGYSPHFLTNYYWCTLEARPLQSSALPSAHQYINRLHSVFISVSEAVCLVH